MSGWASSNVTRNADLIRVVCLPFISILNAIGNPRIDYFSLDIEGAELAVLKAIPWEKVDIKVKNHEIVLHIYLVFTLSHKNEKSVGT